jgi:hypothetical protein
LFTVGVPLTTKDPCGTIDDVAKPLDGLLKCRSS